MRDVTLEETGDSHQYTSQDEASSDDSSDNNSHGSSEYNSDDSSDNYLDESSGHEAGESDHDSSENEFSDKDAHEHSLEQSGHMESGQNTGQTSKDSAGSRLSSIQDNQFDFRNSVTKFSGYIHDPADSYFADNIPFFRQIYQFAYKFNTQSLQYQWA